jgi:hypothetical protein
LSTSSNFSTSSYRTTRSYLKTGATSSGKVGEKANKLWYLKSPAANVCIPTFLQHFNPNICKTYPHLIGVMRVNFSYFALK